MLYSLKNELWRQSILHCPSLSVHVIVIGSGYEQKKRMIRRSIHNYNVEFNWAIFHLKGKGLKSLILNLA